MSDYVGHVTTAVASHILAAVEHIHPREDGEEGDGR